MRALAIGLVAEKDLGVSLSLRPGWLAEQLRLIIESYRMIGPPVIKVAAMHGQEPARSP